MKYNIVNILLGISLISTLIFGSSVFTFVTYNSHLLNNTIESIFLGIALLSLIIGEWLNERSKR